MLILVSINNCVPTNAPEASLEASGQHVQAMEKTRTTERQALLAEHKALNAAVMSEHKAESADKDKTIKGLHQRAMQAEGDLKATQQALTSLAQKYLLAKRTTPRATWLYELEDDDLQVVWPQKTNVFGGVLCGRVRRERGGRVV